MERIEVRCECRADDERLGPGRLTGVLLTEGERAHDRSEVFAPGALSWPAAGVVLNRQHARRAPIMRIVPERRGADVVVDVRLPDTTAGRDAAAEVRSGLLAGLSVEFRARRQRYDGGRRVILDAVLTGAALVDAPSYDGARVELRRRRRRRRIWL